MALPGDVTRPDPVTAAAAVVSDCFATVELAVLTGSVSRGQGTPTSDLDIVVVLDGPPAPYRQTLRSHGWLVELFVHDRASLDDFYALERTDGRATLAHMMAFGVAVAGDPDGELQRRAREWVADGPAPLTTPQLDQCRYALTSEIDDLRDATHPDERDAIAAQMTRTVADLALRSAGRWVGTGKWLFRLLQEYDVALATELAEARRGAIGRGDVNPLCLVAERVLKDCGGPLDEGYAIDAPPR